MLERGRFIRTDILFFLSIMLLIVGLTLWSSEEILPTAFAVIDCVDEDGDDYYHEDCLADDLGCEKGKAYIIESSSQQSVDADEEYLVYKDDRSGEWDIFLYDLASLSSVQVDSSETIDISPEISSGHVVWQSLISNVWQVYGYDIEDGISYVVSPTSSHQISPDVSSSWIVWADFRNENWDIYGYSSGVEHALITGEGDQTKPRMYENYLVYVDDRNGNEDIYLYDLESGIRSQISSGSGSEVHPDTDGEYIVWQTDESGNWDIYAYEISSSETFVVSKKSIHERFPRISEGVVVWMGDTQIYYSDLRFGDTRYLTSDSYEKYVPVIASGDVYWIDYVNGNSDIYGISLNSACELFFGDCADDNAGIYPDATEVCADSLDNNCNGDVDIDCAETMNNGSCFVEGVDSHLWADEHWSEVIHSAADGEFVYSVSYGDGSCSSDAPTFYVYSTVYDEKSGSYITGALEDILPGTMENYPHLGYDVAYADWNAEWPGQDTYYYFITLLGDVGVIGDTILVCASSESCNGESVSVADAEDYLDSLLTDVPLETGECVVDEDCDTGYSCVDSVCAADEDVDCNAQWDCSALEWSACTDGISTRDLNLCATIPEDEECYAEEYLPEYEKACSSGAEAASATDVESKEQVDAAEVPFFSWLNLFLVVGLLIGYYFCRKI